MFFDITIVGAGVVGLSIAKFCSEQGYSVVILDQESRAVEGVSSRNSGVLHAGIYYPENSLKTKYTEKSFNKMETVHSSYNKGDTVYDPDKSIT